MTVHIALLRGINVGGHKRVAMADLRALLKELGFADAQSWLQSGNLVFQGGARRGEQLERWLEAAAVKRLNLESDFFVRTAQEWQAVVQRNAFPEAAKRDPSHLLVMFLKVAPGRPHVEALRAAITGKEVVRVEGREAYIVYPNGVGRSRLTGAVIEKKLGTRGTARNWNTILKLAAMACCEL